MKNLNCTEYIVLRRLLKKASYDERIINSCERDYNAIRLAESLLNDIVADLKIECIINRDIAVNADRIIHELRYENEIHFAE